MLNGIKRFFFDYRLKKDLNQHLIQRQVLSFNQAKHIGILFHPKDEKPTPGLNKLIKKLEKEKKRVTILGFSSTTSKQLAETFQVYTTNETNWFDLPVESSVLDFKAQKFDILINAYLSLEPSLEYLTSLSNAQFRVGPYIEDKTHCFDFMINAGEKSLDDYLENVSHYLGMINSDGK